MIVRRDWPQLFGQYVGPSEQDLTRSPHLRASLLVEAPVRRAVVLVLGKGNAGVA